MTTSNIPIKQFLFGLLIAMFSTSALASPINCGSKPISLAFFNFGLLYFEKDGQGQGIGRDVVDELIKRTGCKFITQLMPRARTWNDLSSGYLDMTLDGVENPERRRFGWFIPYNQVKNYALIRTSAAPKEQGSNSFLEQKNLQFGVVRSFKHGVDLENWLDRMRAENRVQESANIDILFNKLMLGRIDAMFAPPPVYRKFLKDLNIQDDVSIQDWAPNDTGIIGSFVLAKSRFSEADAEEWIALVKEMRKDGTFKRIYARYLSADDAARMADF